MAEPVPLQTRRELLPLGVAAAIAAASVTGALGVIAGLQPQGAVLLGAALLVAVLVVTRPDTATVLVIVLIYSNATVVGVKLHGLPLVVGAAVPLLLAAPLAYHLIARRQRPVITPATPFLVGFFVVAAVSALASDTPRASLSEVGNFLVEGLGLYLLVTNTVRTDRLLMATVWALLGIGGILGLVGVYQWFTQDEIVLFGLGQAPGSVATGEDVFGETEIVRQFGGPIGEQNRFAQVMIVLAPLGMFLALIERGRLRRALAIAATLLTVVAVILSFSRGAAIALFAILTVGAALRLFDRRLLLVAAVALTVVIATVPVFRERLTSLSAIATATAEKGSVVEADTSIQGRWTENLAAVHMWEDHPLIGVGPGGYPRSYREYAEQIGIRVQLADRQPHNLYLGLAAETGLLGLACFLGVVGVTLATLWRARRRMLLVDPARAAMLSGFILSVVAYLTTAVFLHLSFQRYFWLLMALAGAATYLASRSPAIPAPRLRPERDPRAAVPCAARSTGSHPSLP